MQTIKRLADLTNKELLAIKTNSDEYNNIIDLECAHNGISLLPEHPGLEPSKSATQPDSIMYKVGNFGFGTITDAEDVICFMESKGIWREETKSEMPVLFPMDKDHYYYPDIKKVPVYTEAAFAQIKDEAEFKAVIWQTWKDKNDEYQAILKERGDIISTFKNKVAYAKELSMGATRITTNLQRYLALSQGSYPIAVRFLKEADKHNEVVIDDADNVYYKCTQGVDHLITTRVQHQQDCMSDLLGAPI